MALSSLIQTLLLFLSLVAWRLYSILPSRKFQSPSRKKPNDTCSLAVFLGSGGHTSEAMALLTGIDFKRYQPREYIISEGDSLSAGKALALEQSIADLDATPSYRILMIPRARRVHQSLLTTPFTALISLASCIQYMTIDPLTKAGGRPFADVLILNGPGTCLMLCIAAYINKFLGLPAPIIIYVESFARVKGLSLSGKLIQPFVDRFIVQWPELQQRYPKAECHGVLV